MRREGVRDLKRALRVAAHHTADGLACKIRQSSALALLERSIAMKHRRLAVIRLGFAAGTGAAIPAAHWKYCFDAAHVCGDSQLLETYQAASAAHARLHVAAEPRAGGALAQAQP